MILRDMVHYIRELDPESQLLSVRLTAVPSQAEFCLELSNILGHLVVPLSGTVLKEIIQTHYLETHMTLYVVYGSGQTWVVLASSHESGVHEYVESFTRHKAVLSVSIHNPEVSMCGTSLRTYS